ncbi:response regulator [Bdellovibrio sp. HCB337]|uniref:response regulator n=1 Tax=Bdellovibrio sp. HCB337 TaxID=3394358 RepID=UPI0039A63F6F
MTNLSALVVDHSASYIHGITASLKALGCAEDKIYSAKKYADAQNIIATKKPDILITEYSVEGKSGLELINQLNAQSANKISVIISHNNSGVSIAEAAEELVDDYIVKPFQGGQVSERLKDIIRRKVNPSDYIKNIRAGKQMLIEKRLNEAENYFLSAVPLEKKPTLARYYMGYTKVCQNNYPMAVDEFKKGLAIQPLHFKCLTGSFDALFDQKAYASAYHLAPTILNNYPIGAKRLGNLFISAVFSGHLEEVPKYYSIFLTLDNVTPELRKVFSAALLAAGRFQINRNEIDKAAECFELGVQVLGPEVEYIDKAVRALLKTKDKGPQHAQKILQRFPKGQVGSKEHSSLVFLISTRTQTRAQAIELGRKLLINNYADAECYQTYLQLLIADSKITTAEDVAAKASRDFPALRKTFYDLLETAPKK